jgi:hypothetical protein
VIEDAGGDQWMSDLQEHRWSAPQEGDEWRIAETPDHAFRCEVAIPALDSLRVGSRARIFSAGPTFCHANRMPQARTRPPVRPSGLILRFERNPDQRGRRRSLEASPIESRGDVRGVSG